MTFVVDCFTGITVTDLYLHPETWAKLVMWTTDAISQGDISSYRTP